MANETLMSVPNNVTDPQQLRLFLTNLIIRLDIVIGYRGEDGLLQFKDKLTGDTTLEDLAEVSLTISDPPTQVEIQEVLKTVNAIIRSQQDILAALRSTGIIGE